MKKNNKGFTLMEMLIVVAIIAVLVAIMIPSISSSLTKAKEAADVANIRAYYAEVIVEYMQGDDTSSDDTSSDDTSSKDLIAWTTKTVKAYRYLEDDEHPDLNYEDKEGSDSKDTALTYTAEKLNGTKKTYTWKLPDGITIE